MRTNLMNSSVNSNKGATKAATTPTNAREDFLAFFNSGVSLPKLKEGVYDCTLKDASFIVPKALPGKEPNPYVKLELQLADRIITDNRFQNNFELFLNQVREQLDLEDAELPVQEILAMLKDTTFKLWISYAIVDGKQYRNINYLPPLEAETTVTSIPQY